jgi:hypothetical protein
MVGRRSLSSLHSPQKLKWLKRFIVGTVAIGGGCGIFMYYRLKQVYNLRSYMTEDEIEQCRATAQKVIREQRDQTTPHELLVSLGPRLLAPYIPFTLEREKVESSTVRAQKAELAGRETRDLLAVLVRSDKKEAFKAMANLLLFLVYYPEQIEILLNSKEALEQISKGKLLTAEEIEQLRRQQTGTDAPPWDEV